ncbi:MAG: hypothetical protein ACTSQB_01255 [Candidatus Heimdallarchaeota archaeon]
MPPKIEDDAFADAVEGKIDELRLEIRKEEKDTKTPTPMYKIVLIFIGAALIGAGISCGIAGIICVTTEGDPNCFSEWVVIMLMIFGGMAVSSGGISGVWGGQRSIPIRMVSPSDASVVGKGIIVTGYVIEGCLDDEIELTIYGKDKDVIYEELIPITEDYLFYSKLDGVFEKIKRSENIQVETWMVSTKSKKVRFAVREKKFDDLNIIKEGLKIGKVHFFPVIYKDFTDKVKAIYDPKRKEKGVIENVKINKDKKTNIFYPSKEVEDKFIPFSFKKVGEMRQNALYFDIKRRRRLYYSLMLFGMSILFFIYPIINALMAV